MLLFISHRHCEQARPRYHRVLRANLWPTSVKCVVSLCGSEGKESACNAGDPGSIPGHEDPLEKGMATHSSILAWRI